ncbi:MAG: hypothetical protein HY748_05465 [Elusimicrobia bacterium]|nr:hypothetical protein [Elusimicrobiota bacterium]
MISYPIMAGPTAILGVWDGHDAGSAILVEGSLLAAANEERFTRRKLEVHFPEASIGFCLRQAGLRPDQVSRVALSTTDPSKAMTRWLPSLKEENYLLRRRKKLPDWATPYKRRFKFWVTSLRPNCLSRALSSLYASKRLRAMGFRDFELKLVDHHLCHAHSAAVGSGLPTCLVVSLDGVGDGSCGGVWEWAEGPRAGRLREVARLEAWASLGIFFETVTHLMNFREVEDEGKVMTLADYACPVPDADNPMLRMFTVEDLRLASPLSRRSAQVELERLAWRFPADQFAFMAHRTVEVNVLELFRQAMAKTGMKDVAYAGGIAANVKVNRLIREKLGVRSLFVFPHMGDGGLAVGGAWALASELGVPCEPLGSVFLGPGYADEEIERLAAAERGIILEKVASPAKTAAGLIASGEAVFWFQGRMEYGPRALGARSILARPDSLPLKDSLNLRLKRRAWHQPFGPSMLACEASRLLEEYRDAPNPYMTVAYMVKKDCRGSLAGVISADGTCRPQMVPEDDSPYSHLLQELRRLTGLGAVLNTSFNRHGEPIVCSPEDAFRAFSQAAVDHMVIGSFLAKKAGAP